MLQWDANYQELRKLIYSSSNLRSGHEVIGVVDAVGDGVTQFKIGETVGVGWFSSHCGNCHACKQDVWVCCDNVTATGLHSDGGFAEYLGTIFLFFFLKSKLQNQKQSLKFQVDLNQKKQLH